MQSGLSYLFDRSTVIVSVLHSLLCRDVHALGQRHCVCARSRTEPLCTGDPTILSRLYTEHAYIRCRLYTEPVYTAPLIYGAPYILSRLYT
jgi:hypothetical protein